MATLSVHPAAVPALNATSASIKESDLTPTSEATASKPGIGASPSTISSAAPLSSVASSSKHTRKSSVADLVSSFSGAKLSPSASAVSSPSAGAARKPSLKEQLPPGVPTFIQIKAEMVKPGSPWAAANKIEKCNAQGEKVVIERRSKLFSNGKLAVYEEVQNVDRKGHLIRKYTDWQSLIQYFEEIENGQVINHGQNSLAASPRSSRSTSSRPSRRSSMDMPSKTNPTPKQKVESVRLSRSLSVSYGAGARPRATPPPLPFTSAKPISVGGSSKSSSSPASSSIPAHIRTSSLDLTNRSAPAGAGKSTKPPELSRRSSMSSLQMGNPIFIKVRAEIKIGSSWTYVGENPSSNEMIASGSVKTWQKKGEDGDIVAIYSVEQGVSIGADGNELIVVICGLIDEQRKILVTQREENGKVVDEETVNFKEPKSSLSAEAAVSSSAPGVEKSKSTDEKKKS